ncbi:unnamed protein product [Brugia timori]|uniref:L27 domain-containing protein n=1 Tax=Brugia timori TaxID=42155 RepID=A0A0R3QL59_9BILA|nr:unnamed protein product [Brugia timori]
MYRKTEMPKANVCSEVTISNIRLAVRQAVADFCANPERTVESIVNAKFEKSFSSFVEPIQRLIIARLESIYGHLQHSILSPSNEPPSSESVLRFLSEHNDESEKDIVQRFEKDNASSRKHIHKHWQEFRTSPLMPVNPAALTIDIPPLDNLTSGHSSRDNTNGRRRESSKDPQNSNSFSFSKSTSTTSHTSSNSSLSSNGSLLQTIQKSEHKQKLLPGRKSSATSSRSVTERSSQYVRSNSSVNVNDEVLVEIRKTADVSLPVVLKEKFVPSVPLKEATIYSTLTNEKSEMPVSLRSDEDKVTVQYIPTKIPTTDAAVSTDPVLIDNQSVEKVEVGVNTIIEISSNMADGSSSSNTTSDNSAGQLPKRFFDTVLQRPSLRIVSLRPDGSIVPTINSASPNFPSIREWTPLANEGSAEKSDVASEADLCNMASESNLIHSGDSGMEKLDSVSASASRPDPFEEDLNTLANISPLPHS